LVQKKKYLVNNKQYTILHFLETGFDETVDSYYLEGEDFICFYKYADNDFLYLDSPEASKVSTQFLKDSTFFAMLKLRKIDEYMGRDNN
jgi:hypothetical protein